MSRAAHVANQRMGDIQRSVDRLRSRFGGLAGGLVAGLSGGAFASFVKSGIDTAGSMNEVAQKVGITVERLSTLKYAAEQSNSSFESLSGGLGSLSNLLGKAKLGAKEVEEKFQALGFSMGQIKNLDTETAFERVVAAMATTKDASEKAAIAAAFFGRSAGPDMVPFLDQGIQAIEAQEQALRDMGGEMSKEAAEAADAFNDTLGALTTQINNVATIIGSGLVKSLGDVKLSLADPQFRASLEAFGSGIGSLFNFILANGARVASVFTTIGTAIGETAGWLQQDFGDFGKLADVWTRTPEERAANRGVLAQPTPPATTPTGIALPPVNLNLSSLFADGSGGKKKRSGGGKKSPAQQLQEDIDRLVQSLQVQTATFDQTSAHAQIYELSLRGATEAQLANATALADSLDGMERKKKAEEELKRAAEERQRVITQGLEQLREETRATNTDLIENDKERALAQLEIESEKWDELLLQAETGSKQWMEIMDARDEWRSAKMDEISKRFADTHNEMTEFVKEAARNMQDAMADFFFDAMQGKFGDLATSFKATLDRMVANLLASQLMNFLMGDFAETGKMGGYLGDGAKGGGFMGGLLKMLGFARGGVFNSGRIIPLAAGGVVSSPMLFPLANGLGLMGEAGPEAVLPLSRLPGGELGVRAQGGSQPVTVIMNITTPNAESFRRSQGQITADYARHLRRAQRNL